MSKTYHKSQFAQLFLPGPPSTLWYKRKDGEGYIMPKYLEVGGFVVAWDIAINKASKAFGLFPTPEAFIEALMAQAERFGYETILSGHRCKLYIDIEWYAVLDDIDHTHLKKFMGDLRRVCLEVFNLNPKLYVTCCSRILEDKGPKNSYHVVAADIAFECNHDGKMKGFLQAISRDNNWQVNGEDVADWKVYTNYRNLRAPLCCKKGSTNAMVCITTDPLREVYLPHDQAKDPANWSTSVENYLPYYATVGTYADDIVVIDREEEEEEKGSKKATSATSAAVRQKRQQRQACVDVPVPIETIVGMLRERGDDVSVFSSAKYLPDGDMKKGEWQLQFTREEGRNKAIPDRPCLVSCGRIHKANNCIVFIKRTLFPDSYRVEYFCPAAECNKTKVILGTISAMSGAVEEWPGQGCGEAMYNAPLNNDELSLEIIDLDDPFANTYEKVKERFEINTFKVKSPFAYVNFLESKLRRGIYEPDILTDHDLKACFCDLYYFTPTAEGVWAPMPFITRWVKDAHKKVVDEILVDPADAFPNVHNLWQGFIIEKVPAIPSTSIAELTLPINKHIHDVLTTGVAAHTLYIREWIANMFQFPERKTNVALLFYGAMGAGKGLIWEWLRTGLMGPSCTYQTAQPARDLLGKHSNGFLAKVFVQVDETPVLHQFSSELKDMISNDTITYEKKHCDGITVQNLANFVFTTNDPSPFKVSSDERRFSLFECCPIYKGNVSYFVAIRAHMKREDVRRAYYQEAMALDLSAYKTHDFQTARPITKYYIEQQLISASPESQFWSGMVNNSNAAETFSLSANELYDKYIAFCQYSNAVHAKNETPSATKWGAMLGSLPPNSGISRFQSNGRSKYRLDMKLIKQYLIQRKEYNKDIELPPLQRKNT